MKIATTLFLKIAVILIGIPVLALCIFLVPELADAVTDFLGDHSIKYIIFILLYGGALLFYIALYQAFKLLSYIDKNIAFSELSVRTLMRIKYCAISICGLHVLGLPLYYLVADKDDAQVSYLLEWSFLLLRWLSQFLLLFSKGFCKKRLT